MLHPSSNSPGPVLLTTHPTLSSLSFFRLIRPHWCCPSILGCVVFYWSTGSLSGAAHSEKTDFPSSSSHLVSMPTPLPWAGICIDLSLHGSCVCCHYHCEPICLTVLLGPENIVPLQPPTTPTPSYTVIPEPLVGLWYRCLIKGWTFCRHLFPAPWWVVGLCIHHHLLLKEGFLMMAEKINALSCRFSNTASVGLIS